VTNAEFPVCLRDTAAHYTNPVSQFADIETQAIIVGGGAAGLMAGIWAGRTLAGLCGADAHLARDDELSQDRALEKPARQRPASCIHILDGARTLGAKILVAGGGRCNVTHDVVDETAFAGSTPNAIRKVLRRFDVPRTIEFFQQLGVDLKREETGKLFPITDTARTVLNAMLEAAAAAHVQITHPWRVAAIERLPEGFLVRSTHGDSMRTQRVVLATGGRSLPKSGSDGAGYELARRLGHTITPRVFPALVPLTLPRDHWLCALSGVATPVTLEVHSSSGKRLRTISGAMLCTHVGISGPAALDISRHLLQARFDDPNAALIVNWLGAGDLESVDHSLRELGKISPGRWLRESGLPERLARALCENAGVDPGQPGHSLTRERRRALATLITRMPLPITGDRGFAHAEVTAGGVPLSEIRLDTMESRVCPGLYLCGEICDVDGRIGGYNFQWAWASGYIAGVAVGQSITEMKVADERSQIARRIH
jgi:predicted Rossmann fold flavoprotein